jgi:hypothetical protein
VHVERASLESLFLIRKGVFALSDLRKYDYLYIFCHLDSHCGRHPRAEQYPKQQARLPGLSVASPGTCHQSRAPELCWNIHWIWRSGKIQAFSPQMKATWVSLAPMYPLLMRMAASYHRERMTITFWILSSTLISASWLWMNIERQYIRG